MLKSHPHCLICLYLSWGRIHKNYGPESPSSKGWSKWRGKQQDEPQVGSVLCQFSPERLPTCTEVRKHAPSSKGSLGPASSTSVQSPCGACQCPQRFGRLAICGSIFWLLPCPSLRWLNLQFKRSQPTACCQKIKILK